MTDEQVAGAGRAAMPGPGQAPDGDVVRELGRAAGLDPGKDLARGSGWGVGRTEATRVIASLLGQWTRLARWPSLLLALGPVLPLTVGLGIAVSYGVGSAALAILLPVLAGSAATVGFTLRRRRYLEAVTDVDELAAQLRAILEPQLVTSEAVELIHRVTERGGLFLLRRLRAVWKLLTFPDHVLSTLERHDRARWFVPPRLGASGALLSAQLWTVVLSWPLAVTLLVVRLV